MCERLSDCKIFACAADLLTLHSNGSAAIYSRMCDLLEDDRNTENKDHAEKMSWMERVKMLHRPEDLAETLVQSLEKG